MTSHASANSIDYKHHYENARDVIKLRERDIDHLQNVCRDLRKAAAARREEKIRLVLGQQWAAMVTLRQATEAFVDEDGGYIADFPNDWLVSIEDSAEDVVRAQTPEGLPRTFTVYRRGDLSATHTPDLVNPANHPQYEGVVFEDGTTVIRWMTAKKSTSVFASFEDLWAVHGHSSDPRYQSEVVWH